MNVTITDIDQSFSLETGAVANFIVLQLPSGKKVRAPIDDETVQRIIVESRGDTQSTEKEPEPVNQHLFEDFDYSTQSAPVESLEQYEDSAPSGVVEWETLPESQLSAEMKKILKDSRINPIISVEDLETLKSQILERIGKKTKPGKVEWNTGPARDAKTRPRRSVPMDEAGNPMPPGGIAEADPGEVQDDDDGVAQA